MGGIALPELDGPLVKGAGSEFRRRRGAHGLIVCTREKRPWERTAFYGKGQVIDPDGGVAVDLDWMPNTLADDGEVDMGNVYLKGNTNSSKYLGLLNDGTVAETDDVSTVTEAQTPAANGYNRQQLVAGTWPTFTVVSGDGKATYPEVTFGAASATWTLTHAFICDALTSQAGTVLFIAYIALAATTTVNSGQSFKYTLTWTNT